ncbi:MAG: glycyl-radical enzyme activating protein [Clostridia bacterium]|nr:glycyl-radical enzyme activating protein [Clostridia bacterium]
MSGPEAPSGTGRIYDIKRFAVHDGPGIRTVVFLKGCPLRCAWCHNPEGMSAAPDLSLTLMKCVGCGDCVRACPNGAHSLPDVGVHEIDRTRCTLCGACVEACVPGALRLYGREVSVEALLAEVSADRPFYEQSGGGVTLSGGEPLSQPAFAAAFLRACRAAGLHTALDTSGAVPWDAFEAVLPHTDLVLYDIKHIDPEAHRTWTGLDNVRILDNLRRLGRAGVPIEVRIPCLPGVNDGDVLERIAVFLREIPSLTAVRLLPYHDFARSKFAAIGREDTMPRVERPGPEAMAAMRAVMVRHGLRTAE